MNQIYDYVCKLFSSHESKKKEEVVTVSKERLIDDLKPRNKEAKWENSNIVRIIEIPPKHFEKIVNMSQEFHDLKEKRGTPTITQNEQANSKINKAPKKIEKPCEKKPISGKVANPKMPNNYNKINILKPKDRLAEERNEYKKIAEEVKFQKDLSPGIN